MSNLDALIQAARYLEENEHEDEDEESPSKRTNRYTKQKKPTSYNVARSRTTHNLLEKNRRAQLRDCLEVLRQHVPLPDKLTTLALLQSARKYIESLQQKEREDNQVVEKLQNEQAYLLSRLVELGATNYVNSFPSETTSHSEDSSSQTMSSDTVENDMIVRASLSPKNVHGDKEEDESVLIDVMNHESEDDTSSTTSGSDGGCTTTSHKYEVTV